MSKAFVSKFTAVVWITLSLAVTLLMAGVLFGWAFVKAEWMPWMLLTSLFIIVAFLVYRALWANHSVKGPFADTFTRVPDNEEKLVERPAKK